VAPSCSREQTSWSTDALVNPELVGLAPRSAEIIFGGKRGRQNTIAQPELNQLLIEKARAGKTVVRLKGGDPYVFGRGAEEAQDSRPQRSLSR
jgi:uroporphyrinogen III methyltransferase/synthase